MESMTVYQAGTMTAQRDLTGGLFMDFVRYIDRSENTTRAYIINLRQFMAWLRFKGITQPTREDILSYREWLTTEHDAIQLAPETAAGWEYRTDRAGDPIKVSCKANTVAQYLRSVCQFFRWTAASGIYPDVAANIHAPKLKNNTHKKDALTAEEVLTIEDSISAKAQERTQEAAQADKDQAGKIQRSTEQGKRLYAMYLLAVNAGLRTIEISRANVKDIETKSGQAYIYIWGKGHAEADTRKALAPEVKAALDDYLRSRTDKPTGSSPLFVSTGNRAGGKRIAPTTISTMLKQAMQQAGFDSERITAHSLRHTAGTNVQELTGNLYLTQQYMRHSNPATTEIYLHNDTDRQQADIAKRLYDYYHGETTGTREKLGAILDTMTPAQIEQLTAIAQAMQG